MAENITGAHNSIMSRLVKYWLPVLVMIAAMYYFSTDVLSGENTRGVLDTLLAWAGLDVSRRTIERLNYITRKAAHFVEYAMLAGLLFRAFRADATARWKTSWALYSMLICAVWALIDEYRQSLSDHRSGSLNDSLLDCAGALFMLALVWYFNRSRRSRLPGEEFRE
jgi:VanZ family protein